MTDSSKKPPDEFDGMTQQQIDQFYKDLTPEEDARLTAIGEKNKKLRLARLERGGKDIDWGQATVDALKRHTAGEGSMLNRPMREAIRLALETHEINDKQKRKGKDVPYITHPLTVGFILARAGARQETILAGILHDVLEDSVADHKVTYDMLREQFGWSVAEIVKSVTEPNKDLPWAERKEAALEHLKTIEGPGLWVKAADVISNVSELLDDYARAPVGEGDAIFERFNAPKADVIANYLAVMDVLIKKPLTPEGEEKTLVLDLKTLRADLHGLAQL